MSEFDRPLDRSIPDSRGSESGRPPESLENPAKPTVQKATKRRAILIAALTSVALGLAALAYELLQPSGPRERFRKELRNKVADLISELHEFGPGMKEDIVDISFYQGDQLFVKQDTMLVPRASFVVSKARKVQEHFGMVSLAFVKEGTDGLEEWGERLRKDIWKYNLGVVREIKRIEQDYQQNPAAFGTLGWTKTHKLYFVGGNGDRSGRSLCVVEDVFDFGLDAWLKDVKGKAQDFTKREFPDSRSSSGTTR